MGLFLSCIHVNYLYYSYDYNPILIANVGPTITCAITISKCF